MTKAGIISEMMDDAMESAMDSEDLEEETEEQVGRCVRVGVHVLGGQEVAEGGLHAGMRFWRGRARVRHAGPHQCAGLGAAWCGLHTRSTAAPPPAAGGQDSAGGGGRDTQPDGGGAPAAETGESGRPARVRRSWDLAQPPAVCLLRCPFFCSRTPFPAHCLVMRGLWRHVQAVPQQAVGEDEVEDLQARLAAVRS